MTQVGQTLNAQAFQQQYGVGQPAAPAGAPAVGQTLSADAFKTQYANAGTAQQEGAQLHDTGSFGGNLANSAGNFFKQIGTAIAHPIDTVKNLGGVALGGAEKLIPGQQGAEHNFDNVVDYYKQRYGSVDNFLTTLKQDPVGLAGDASILLDGLGAVAGGVKAGAEVAGAADAAKFAGKAEDLAHSAATMTNPLTAVTKPISKAGEVLQGLQDSLSKKNLNLTPLQEQNLGAKIAPIVEMDKMMGVAGDAKKLETVTNIYNKLEDSISGSLEKNQISPGVSHTIAINPAPLIQQLEDISSGPQFIGQKGAFKPLINYLQENAATLSAEDIQTIKRSLGDQAYRGNFGEILSNEAKDAAREVFQKGLEEALPNLRVQVPPEVAQLIPGLPEALPIGEYNKVYGAVITYKKILARAGTKADVGFLRRIASEIVGGAAGHALGGLVGGYVGAKAADVLVQHAPIKEARVVAGKAAKAAGDILVKTPKVAKPLNLSRVSSESR